MLQGTAILKFVKFLRIRCYGRVEKMHQQQIPDQLAAATVEGTTKRGRQRKILRDEFEDGLNIMGMKKTGRQCTETVGNGGRVHWKQR